MQKQPSEENRVATAAATANTPRHEEEQQQKVTEGQSNDEDSQGLSNKIEENGREEEKGESGEGAEGDVKVDVVEREFSSSPPTSATLSNEQQPQPQQQHQQGTNSGDSKDSNTTL